jgi:UPF0755 protein
MKRSLLLLIIILTIAFFIFQGIYLPKSGKSDESKVFLVSQGEGLDTIAQNLKNQGIIKSKYLFVILASIEDESKNLEAGEYKLSPAMSISQVLDKISSGQRIKRTITILEGWGVEDINKYLKEKNIEGEIAESFEGYLFPDTYEVFLEDNSEEIAKIMKENFENKISGLKKEIALNDKSVLDIIKMASIIEREVRTIEDKKIVSGILWKRIEADMPLQVDASRETYGHLGLPISPICNPGIDSLTAAVYPQKSSYWFYLSALDGKTIFSKTLAEHERAIERYLK